MRNIVIISNSNYILVNYVLLNIWLKIAIFCNPSFSFILSLIIYYKKNTVDIAKYLHPVPVECRMSLYNSFL